MADSVTVGSRQAVITLPIDARAFLEEFEAVERLSELFEITASVVFPDGPVEFFAHLGGAVVITISDVASGRQERVFHGLLFEAEFVEDSAVGMRYRLTIRPWAYALTRNLDYTIYQDKGALDIIKAQFDKRGCTHVEYTKVAKTPAPREYCVQYRESDFAFVSRLMEEEGIYYFFEHTQNAHTLVLCDGRASQPASSYSDGLLFNSTTGGSWNGQDGFWRWNERVSSTAEHDVVLRNWDFKQPDQPLQADYNQGETTPAETAQVFDFPAGFLKATPAGETLGETILQAARRERRLYLGVGDAMALACGQIFKLYGHALSRLDQDYLIVGLRYRVVTESYRSGANSTDPGAIVEIEAIPADTQYRAPILTPRPVARGPETAIVKGPSNEEIYTDEFGRVRVRFHWDRGDSPDETASCWVRVSSSWAGKTYGELFLPRVGQEVVIDFLDGDPDRPLVTGRVYNASLKESQTLPADKTKSGLRTQTAYGKSTEDYDGAVSPPKDEPGFNEIAFEDKSGKELLTIRAQRDMKEDVYRDETRYTHRDQTEEIGRDRKTTIHTGNDTYELEKGDESHKVTQGKRTTQIQENESLKVVMGDMSTEVSQGNQSTKISVGNQTTDVSMGNISIKCDLGKIEVEALQSIELKVGQSSIKIDQMGVTIKGMMVTSEAQIQLQTKGMMAQHNADVLMTIKGAITMIN
jgi:type VI secretion system secreted protein VgrG